MKGNNYFEVFWKQVNPSTFMYGTKLSIKDGVTVFENPLMPSGIIIQDWVMKTSYALDKELPTLPILKKGHTYTFQFDYEVQPKQGIYFKIIFYRKNGTVLSTQIVQEKQVAVTYPEEAFAYKIQMINAASQYIRFEKFSISEQKNDTIELPTLQISEIQNEDIQSSVLNMIVVEPSNMLMLPLTSTAINHLNNVVVVNQWFHDLEETLQQLKIYIEQLEKYASVHLISYGAKGNVLVSNINHLEQTNVKGFITTERDELFSQRLKELVNNQSLINPIPVEVFYNPKIGEYDKANKAIFTVLNPSRYLKHLDVARVNHGGANETEN